MDSARSCVRYLTNLYGIVNAGDNRGRKAEARLHRFLLTAASSKAEATTPRPPSGRHYRTCRFFDFIAVQTYCPFMPIAQPARSSAQPDETSPSEATGPQNVSPLP